VTSGLLILNHAVALDRVGGDQELLAEVAQLFLDDYPNNLREIEEALRISDPKLLERAAHTLKGAASNFGADPVVQPALALEMAGRAGNLSQTSGDFQRLTAALQGMHRDLELIVQA
jgi:HPt (histidine-containing phosphotransfer) domain-containing protein